MKHRKTSAYELPGLNMAAAGASLCFFLICLSITNVLPGAAQGVGQFQGTLSGLLPSDALSIKPSLDMNGPQLLPLPTEAEKQAALCSAIAAKQLPIVPSFCTTPPPAGKSPPPPVPSSPVVPPAPVPASPASPPPVPTPASPPIPAPASPPSAPVSAPPPLVPIPALAPTPVPQQAPVPVPAPAPQLVPAPAPSCNIVTTAYSFSFDTSASITPGCQICGGQTFSCNNPLFQPTNPTFTDTSPGTFVSLSATITYNYGGLITLLINNEAQGSFSAPSESGYCNLDSSTCFTEDLVPAASQTGYVMGGLNTFAITGGDSFVCFTTLVLMVKTAVC